MNLPNSLTVARVFLSVIFVIVLSFDGTYRYAFAFVLFLAASITDFLDGYLARRNNQVTDFGRLMDPLADKIMVTAALVLLAVDQLLPAWFVIVILFREFLVTGVRMLALARHQVIAADFWGKLKTVTQIVLICVIFGTLGFREIGLENVADWRLWAWAQTISFWLTLFATVLSGLLYTRVFARSAKDPA